MNNQYEPNFTIAGDSVGEGDAQWFYGADGFTIEPGDDPNWEETQGAESELHVSLLMDGAAMYDCWVEATPQSIDISVDGIYGYRAATPDDVAALESFASWIREAAPWDEAALENARSSLPDEVAWLMIGDDKVLAFPIQSPPRRLVDWLEYLRTLRFFEG